ncbi:MAG TPA: hypothetical protein VLJ37_02450 [bacterium]|nr:hypothetical protein [bacterium]
MITFGAANSGAAQSGNNVATAPQFGAGILIGGGAFPGSPSTGNTPDSRPDVSIVLPDRRTAEALSEALRISGFRIPKEFGNFRIVVASPSTPAATAAGIPLEVGDLHSLQTLLSNPEVLLDALTNAQQHAELSVLSTLLLGSQNVYPTSQRSTGDAPASVFAKFTPAAAETRPAEHGAAPAAAPSDPRQTAAADRGTSARGAETALPKGSAAVETARIPEVVREVLVRLQILPPGVSTDQALPRLQEVIRLWTAEGAPQTDLPADVVRVVNNFLASAVLATALPGQQGTAPSSPEASRMPTSPFGNPLFREGGKADGRFIPLTRADIAQAVINALNQFPVLASRNPMTDRGAAQPNDAVRQGPVVPQAGPAAAKGSEKDAAPARFAEGARLEAGLDRTVRDGKAQPRLSGDEHHERTETADVDLEKRRAAHDQESHPGSSGEEDAHALEALWQELQAALEQGGFVTPEGNVRRLLDAIEGRSFLRLVAGRVPNGLDLIDVLGLINARMGLSPEFGAVNAALHQLASYRTKWKGDKVRAVLEPLHDAFVALDLVDSGIIPVHEAEISAKDLAGFETHAAAAQLLLDHPAWMSRTGADDEDRRELESVLPDVERLVEAVEVRFAAFANSQTRPEYFSAVPTALLN